MAESSRSSAEGIGQLYFHNASRRIKPLQAKLVGVYRKGRAHFRSTVLIPSTNSTLDGLPERFGEYHTLNSPVVRTKLEAAVLHDLVRLWIGLQSRPAQSADAVLANVTASGHRMNCDIRILGQDAIFVGDLQQAKGLQALGDLLKLVVTSQVLERLIDFSREDKLLLPDRQGKQGTVGANLRVKMKKPYKRPVVHSFVALGPEQAGPSPQKSVSQRQKSGTVPLPLSYRLRRLICSETEVGLIDVVPSGARGHVLDCFSTAEPQHE